MDIIFTKISDQQHAVRVKRRDNTVDEVILNTRSYLRHDMAHLTVEAELPLKQGFWGSVASGKVLSGSDIRGSDVMVAELLAGSVQTLMRLESGVDRYLSTLERVIPDTANTELASRIHERARQLQGHWKATHFGGEMTVHWPE